MKTRAILLLTFRELWAKKITLGLFIVSTLAWVLLSFAFNLDIVEGTLAGIRIFGQDTGPPGTAVQDPDSGEWVRQNLGLDQFVMNVEAFVGGASYWLGTLLGLFATAPLLVGLLERGRVDLLLSKPLGRTRLLAGHILGVWLTMILLAVYLLGMVWLVMSLKTGIWNVNFFRAILVIVGMFTVMYSVIVFLGVATQSTALSLITAYGLIFASIILAFKTQLLPQINPPWRQVFLGLYHMLPNFAEVTQTVSQLTGLEPVSSWYPFGSSLLFGAVLYALALFIFARRDF